MYRTLAGCIGRARWTGLHPTLVFIPPPQPHPHRTPPRLCPTRTRPLQHIMIDLGTGNNNKINWAMHDKQEFIDIVETVYRGARKGRGLVVSPKGACAFQSGLGLAALWLPLHVPLA